MSAGLGGTRTRSEQTFFNALRELYLRAGEPSSRTVATAIGGMSHTTVNSALRGSKIPSWPVVAKLVTYFEGDVDQFRTLWTEAREPITVTENPQRSEVSVFVSYARIDDEATYDRVSRLVDDIANTYRSITGKEVGVFRDVDSIAPGDDWKDRIRLGLSSSSIFLAFISPAYLRSPSCREELSEFLAFLDANSSIRLVIPLLYADLNRIEVGFIEDDLWKRISKLQWIDISKLRSTNPGTSEWIQKAEGVADRIDSILTEFAQIETTGPSSFGAGSSKHDDEESDTYFLERMVSLEEDAIPAMTANVERFGVLMAQLGEAVEESGPSLQKADTFSKKLAVSRLIGNRLNPIASELVTLATGIVEDFHELSYAVSYILEHARSSGDFNDPDLVSVVRAIWQMANQGSAALLPIDILTQTLSQGIGFSRDLDRPFKSIQRACLKMADLRGMLNGWMDELLVLEEVYPNIFSSAEGT